MLAATGMALPTPTLVKAVTPAYTEPRCDPRSQTPPQHRRAHYNRARYNRAHYNNEVE